jgi:hypothetical protein
MGALDYLTDIAFDRPPQGGSTIDQLLALIGTKPKSNPAADIGSLLGSFSQGEKANRVVEGNFQGDFDRMMLDREANQNRLGADLEDSRNRMGLLEQTGRNQNESDALRKLQQTAYMKSGGSTFTPPTISLGGKERTAPSFAGISPRQMTGEEMQGASDLQGQVMDRLKPGGSFTAKFDFKPDSSYTPKPVDSYAKPGMAEKITSYGGAGSGILGALMDNFGPGQGIGDLLGKIPGMGKLGSFLGGSGGAGAAAGILGKALPVAGAVTGGAGLIKDQGIGKNIMNGTTAGASIGSMVAPGIGTAVGAGIGAGVGALRSVFGGGPSEQEMAGREMAKQGRQTIISGATPEQIQQAQGAGWKNPQDALTMIVIRDKVLQAGGSIEQANQLMSMLYQAEKGGPQAVEQALTQIMQATGGGR